MGKVGGCGVNSLSDKCHVGIRGCGVYSFCYNWMSILTGDQKKIPFLIRDVSFKNVVSSDGPR